MTGERWDLALPWPSPILSLNSRHTPGQHRRLVAETRELGARLAQAAQVGRHDRVRVELHWRPSSRSGTTQDDENPVPTLKALCDGLVDAQVVPDDDRYRMTKLMPVIHDPEPRQPGQMWLVVVALEPIAGAPPPKAQPVKPRKARPRPLAASVTVPNAPSSQLSTGGAPSDGMNEWSRRVMAAQAARGGRRAP